MLNFQLPHRLYGVSSEADGIVDKVEEHRNDARHGRKVPYGIAGCHAPPVKCKPLIFNSISGYEYSLYRFFAEHSRILPSQLAVESSEYSS